MSGSSFSVYDNGFVNGVIIAGVPLQQTHPGRVFWVGNSATLLPGEKGESNANKGTFLDPFATLDYAIGKCAAGRGDIIFIRPSHAEATTQATSAVVDVDSVAIIGLGQGDDAPTYSNTGSFNNIEVSADNVIIANLRFASYGNAGVSAQIDISGGDCTISGCYFSPGTAATDVLTITVTATGENPTFENNKFVVIGDGPDNFIQIEGVIDNPRFINNTFITSDGTNALDDGGAISFESQAVTNVELIGNKVLSGGVTCNLVVNAGSVSGIYTDSPYVLTGEMDVDVSESDYTTVGGITALTITPTGPMENVTLDLDNNKASTGLLVVNTTETVQYVVERKIDGTNWRVTDHWPAASGKTGLAVPDAADDLDAADDGVGVRFYLGNIGPDEEVRINVELSAETGGDAEIPYALTFKGSSPVLTAVAAA